MSHPDTSWRDDALCTQVAPETFFPERGDNETARDARRICGACRVTEECLAYSLITGPHYGIWGGTSDRERRRMRHGERRAAA